MTSNFSDPPSSAHTLIYFVELLNSKTGSDVCASLTSLTYITDLKCYREDKWQLPSPFFPCCLSFLQLKEPRRVASTREKSKIVLRLLQTYRALQPPHHRVNLTHSTPPDQRAQDRVLALVTRLSPLVRTHTPAPTQPLPPCVVTRGFSEVEHAHLVVQATKGHQVS